MHKYSLMIRRLEGLPNSLEPKEMRNSELTLEAQNLEDATEQAQKVVEELVRYPFEPITYTIEEIG